MATYNYVLLTWTSLCLADGSCKQGGIFDSCIGPGRVRALRVVCMSEQRKKLRACFAWGSKSQTTFESGAILFWD